MEISEVVNSFKSEAVQVKVIDRLLDAILESEKIDGDGIEIIHKKPYKSNSAEDENYSFDKGPKKTRRYQNFEPVVIY